MLLHIPLFFFLFSPATPSQACLGLHQLWEWMILRPSTYKAGTFALRTNFICDEYSFWFQNSSLLVLASFIFLSCFYPLFLTLFLYVFLFMSCYILHFTFPVLFLYFIIVHVKSPSTSLYQFCMKAQLFIYYIII